MIAMDTLIRLIIAGSIVGMAFTGTLGAFVTEIGLAAYQDLIVALLVAAGITPLVSEIFD